MYYIEKGGIIMKKFMAFATVVLMAFTLIPFSGIGIGADVVSGATTSPPVVVGTAPNAPANLSLPSGYSPTETSVKLTWRDNATDETGFKLEREIVGSATWVQIASLSANITSYTDTGLTGNATYKYRVKAYNSYGSSAYSNTLTATTAKAVITPPVVTPPIVVPPVIISPDYSNTPSVWAAAEIDKAQAAGLTVDSLLSLYNKPITRVEFSELVVKLYETATGEIAVAVSPNPFTDTTNEAVLKAYGLGIIKGVSADKFAPNANISRQEIGVMLQRELQAAKPDGIYVVTADYTNVFADESQIAIWAIDAVRFMNQEGIVNGVGGNMIDPKGMATREQSMIMVYRVYEQFVLPAGDNTLPAIPSPAVTEDNSAGAEY